MAADNSTAKGTCQGKGGVKAAVKGIVKAAIKGGVKATIKGCGKTALRRRIKYSPTPHWLAAVNVSHMNGSVS